MLKTYPVLPLRDVVVYPHMMIPLSVGRPRSIEALTAAMLDDKQILLVTQKNMADNDPQANELYSVGTLAVILQLLKLSDGTVRVLVEGSERAKVISFVEHDPCLMAEIELFARQASSDHDKEIEMLGRSLMAQIEHYAKLNKKLSIEPLMTLNQIDDYTRLVDTVAAHLTLKIEEKQQLLEISELKQRIEILMTFLENEIDLLQVEKRIRHRVKKRMEEEHRKYYLQHQREAIDKELGELSGEVSDIESLGKQIEEAGLPKDAKEKALAELKKLKMMSPLSAEASVLRNYLDWMLKVPWKARSKIVYDLEKAQIMLDIDHYGLSKVKERIIEYLDEQSDAGQAYQDAVSRLLGKDKPLRFTKITKKSMFQRLFGGKRLEETIK